MKIVNIDIPLKLKYKKQYTNVKEYFYYKFIQSPFVWETLEDIEIVLSNNQKIIIYKGMETDLISIPPFFTFIFKEYDICLLAYLLHDYLYINDIMIKSNHYENRLFIDNEMLLKANKLNPHNKFGNYTKYIFVRLFGYFVYKRKKE